MKKGDKIDESHYKQEEKDEEDSELLIMLDKFVDSNSIVYRRLSKL